MSSPVSWPAWTCCSMVVDLVRGEHRHRQGVEGGGVGRHQRRGVAHRRAARRSSADRARRRPGPRRPGSTSTRAKNGIGALGEVHLQRLADLRRPRSATRPPACAAEKAPACRPWLLRGWWPDRRRAWAWVARLDERVLHRRVERVVEPGRLPGSGTARRWSGPGGGRRPSRRAADRHRPASLGSSLPVNCL